MLLYVRVSPRQLQAALAAVFSLLILAPGALAQTDTQKAPVPQAQRPEIWAVNCSDNNGKLDCRAGQSIFLKTTGQRILSVAVRVPADTKKPVLMVQVPLGVYLPAGASVRIGNDLPMTLPFKACDQAGCVAEYLITDAEIAAMSKGSDLTISVQNQNQKPAFTLKFPTAGFAAAYAKVK